MRKNDHNESDHASEISTEPASDGQSALNKVQEEAAKRIGTGCWGPKSDTRSHWHDPIKIMEPGKKLKRWQFKCKYCKVFVDIYSHIRI